jgi:hypothetical protein
MNGEGEVCGGLVTGGDDRLRRLLGGEPVAWLVQRARDRLELGAR